ncbi:hypothetical protein [Duganella sp. HH101]|uniref:hypothetical protein n=1 Tax=Duganella sp. HH101 TaxID=1781066 RepID=UPI000873D861|nr:hypothetical protein [Duganella sp. HH101]OFA04823.1 hypothetical protein DUGA2_15660 [Duganella sp. HH101]
MKTYSMDEVHEIVASLNHELAAFNGYQEKVAILRSVAYEPGRAENERVRAYAAEVLTRYPL